MGLDAPEMENKSRIIIILFLTLFTFSCKNNEKPSEQICDPDTGPDKSIEKFTLVETSGDKCKWVMNADRADFLETGEPAGEMIKAENIIIDIYDTGESGTMTKLKAKSGIFDKKSQELDTRGEVIIESGVRKIITEDVRWNPGKAKFITDRKVLIISGENTIRGIGMEASEDLSEIKIIKNITGSIKE